MFKNIRKRIGLAILRRKSKSRLRSKAMFNFDTAETVGVIFKSDNYQEFDNIRKFLLYLTEKNTKVFALCYVDSNKVADYYLLRKGFNVFTRNELGFFFTPQNDWVTEFMDKQFDILIDLSVDDNFPLHYISTLSKSKFKIGKMQNNINSFDLLIDTKKNNTVDELIENIKLYMGLLKPSLAV